MKKQVCVILLGCWLIASSEIVSGSMLVLCGVGLCFTRSLAVRVAVGLIGLWLQLAPLIFWTPAALTYLNDTAVGTLLCILAFRLDKKEPQKSALVPRGWSLNPSAWSHRLPTVALALLASCFARYMAAFQLGYISTISDPLFPGGTLAVITSALSKSFPVSDAGLGALCYTMEFVLGWQGSARRWVEMPWLVMAFGFLVIPVGIVSVVLIILQPLLVGAWCFWCLATAACMLPMIVLTSGELVAVCQAWLRVKNKNRFFWKGATPSELQALAQIQSAPSRGGWSLPPSLLLTTLLGAFTMLTPYILGTYTLIAPAEYILGPLIIAISIIACAEVFRSCRYCLCLCGGLLILTPWFPENIPFLARALPALTGIFTTLLAFPRGKIVGHYTKI